MRLHETSLDQEEFGTFEKVALGLFITLIVAFIIISAWSYILLTLEMIDGGGPIGYFIKAGSTLMAVL